MLGVFVLSMQCPMHFPFCLFVCQISLSISIIQCVLFMLVPRQWLPQFASQSSVGGLVGCVRIFTAPHSIAGLTLCDAIPHVSLPKGFRKFTRSVGYETPMRKFQIFLITFFSSCDINSEDKTARSKRHML